MKKIKLLLITALSGLALFAVQQVHTHAETATIEITPTENAPVLWSIGWNGSTISFGGNEEANAFELQNIDTPANAFSIVNKKNGQTISPDSLAFRQNTTFQLIFSTVKVSITCQEENGKYFLDTGTISGSEISRIVMCPTLMGIASGNFNCSFHWDFAEDVNFYNFANFTIKNNGRLTTRSFVGIYPWYNMPIDVKMHIENGGKFEGFGDIEIALTDVIIESGGEFCMDHATANINDSSDFVNNGILSINSSNVNVINGASFTTGENSFTNLGNNSTLTLNSGNNIFNGTININSGSTLEVNTNATINGIFNNNGGTITGEDRIDDASAKQGNIHNNLSDNIKPIGYINPNYTGSSYDLVYNDSTQDLNDNVAKTIITPHLNNKQVVNVRKIVFNVVTNISSGTLTFDYNQPQIKELLGNLGNYRILKFEGGNWVDASKSDTEPLITSTTGTTTFALVGYSTAPIIVPEPGPGPNPNPNPNPNPDPNPDPGKKPTLPNTDVEPLKPVGSKNRSVNLGKTIQLAVTPNKNITWTSKNKKIATVDKNGKVLGLKSGKVTITATSGKQTVTFTITVEKVQKSYTVKSKTTLAKLAKTLKVSVTDLKKWNKKLAKSKTIKSKTKVVYYVNGTYHVPAKKIYTTKKKITLKQLAKQLKVSESNLKKWNKSLSKAKFVKAKVKVVYYQ